MNLFRKPKPRAPMTDAQKAASAAAYLAQHRKVEEARKTLVTVALERFVAAGGRVPIAPRDVVVAPVRARRETAHG